MFYILITVVLLCLVDGDYVWVPGNGASSCLFNGLLLNQDVVLWDSVTGSCLVNNSDVSMPSRNYYRTFVRDVSNKILLFKLTEGYGPSALSFYRNTSAFNNTFIDWKNDNGVLWHKNVLLKNMTKFKYMIVQLTDAAGVVHAWLKFAVTSADTAESWFSGTALVDAYPWSAASIKAAPYNAFSIAGYNLYDSLRTFVIAAYVSECAKDDGIIVVFEKPDTCYYVTGVEYGTFTPPKIAFYNSTSTSNNTKSLTFVKHMSIIGVLNDGISIYY